MFKHFSSFFSGVLLLKSTFVMLLYSAMLLQIVACLCRNTDPKIYEDLLELKKIKKLGKNLQALHPIQ